MFYGWVSVLFFFLWLVFGVGKVFYSERVVILVSVMLLFVWMVCKFFVVILYYKYLIVKGFLIF